VRAKLPELPAAKRERFLREHRLSEYAAGVLTAHPRTAAYFEEAAMLSGEPVKVGNFIQSEVLRDVVFDGLSASLPVEAKHVAELVQLVATGRISGKQAKQVYAQMRDTKRPPSSIVDSLGLIVISDEKTLRNIAADIVAAHPKQADTYRSGKSGLLGFFVGQLMKVTGGSANPKLASELLKTELEGPTTNETVKATESRKGDQ